MSAYQNISGTIQFGQDTSGSGTASVSDALNKGDVSPNTLPADNATTGYTPVIYVSFYNSGSTDIVFGTTTPTINITDSAGFNGASTCELDVYGQQGSNNNPFTWFSSGATGSISGNTATINPFNMGAGNTIDFKAGSQQIVAIACK